MKKKICTICFVIMMVLSFCNAVSAAEGRVTFSDLTKSSTSVSVKARFEGTGSQSVWLIASYINENAIITAINEAHAEIADGEEAILTVTLEDKSSDSVLKCFLWDGLNGRTPLDNVAPAPPAEIGSFAQTTDSVSLSWTASEDDHESVAGYDIYNMGMKVGSTAGTEFTDTLLERGSNNLYEVVGIDSEGLASPKTKPLAVKAADIPTATCAGAEMTSDGRLIYVLDENYSYYGSSAAAEADGLACRRTVNPAEDGLGSRNIITRHPFRFSADYAAELKGVSNFTLILTYFDNFSGNIITEYCKAGGGPDSFGASMSVAAKNSGQWKTVTYNIVNADFSQMATNAGNSFAKIRIYTSAKNFMVYRLSILPTEEYHELMKNATACITDAYINNGVLVNLTDASEVSKDKIAGQGAALIPAGKAMECDVTDVITAGDSSACVELEYYTETEEEEIVLKYYSQTDGAVKEVRQAATAVGKWQRMRFALTDAAFNNAISGVQLPGGADFTIGAGSGSPIYIHSVRVFKK